MIRTITAKCESIEVAELIARRIKNRISQIKSISIFVPKNHSDYSETIYAQSDDSIMSNSLVPTSLGNNIMISFYNITNIPDANLYNTFKEYSQEVTIQIKVPEVSVKDVTSILISGGALSIKKL